MAKRLMKNKVVKTNKLKKSANHNNKEKLTKVEVGMKMAKVLTNNQRSKNKSRSR